ncbi:NAD(P)H-dependent oxidoreductase [Amycolatopsis australiensis]|uniref:Putative NADPH-quinone reductase (Modulator of drug activity B) n=1 Tax=Amycolatopsis australiensis TaxID=546364 RepID=A0A1K1SAI4_9PSEU|nr:NAD(P)H-dependent oxidoreductase [Amycolatopsis australiensis]SFW81108.1 Putative NADPH-quinone reductase (modulator of drug activity B) [Amycolatopsis australiensis]
MTDEPASRPVVVLVAHPRPGSFNQALAARVRDTLTRAGRPVCFHDLYAEGFDPVLTADEAYTSGTRAEEFLAAEPDPLVRRHRDELRAAGGLVAIHPNWWGKPPAILSGWLDRILVPGVAYRLDDAGGAPESLLSLRRLLVVNTSDTPEDRERTLFGDPLDAIWRRCLAPYLGEPEVARLVLRVVADAGEERRAAWLDDVEAEVRRLFGGH